jgi:serine-type D-Ala-D-Ala carboxypeptidase
MPARSVAGFLHKCLARHLFPAVSVGVYYNGKTTFCNAGYLSPAESSAPAAADTLFDLASITKPVATATSILILRERKVLDIDKPISHYLSEFTSVSGKSDITSRHLLTHSAGLAAWEPLYLFCSSRQEMVHHIANTPLQYPPGTQITYSCLGFIVLAELVTRLSGMTLQAFTRLNIFQPLGMNDTFFNPPAVLKHRIAPTEEGNVQECILSRKAGFSDRCLRPSRIHGEVHDSNAFKADGEGGNAGLFSSSNDLLIFADFMLNPERYKPVLNAQSILFATSNQTEGGNRGLGWQLAESSTASARIFSGSAYGHNGFTGTSIWIDPVKNCAVVFLSNRVYYDGSDYDFNSIRAALHRKILDTITSRE